LHQLLNHVGRLVVVESDQDRIQVKGEEGLGSSQDRLVTTL